MKTVILHHAGDANVPPIRVAHTLRLLEVHPAAWWVAPAGGEEQRALVNAALFDALWGYDDLPRWDTLGEARSAFSILHRGDTLVVSTEEGHRRRAYVIAWVLAFGRGIRVLAPTAPQGVYRDRWWRVLRDAVRAAWVKGAA